MVVKNQVKWDYRFLDLAQYFSKWSKDPSCKVGSVITNGIRFVALGFNGFPAGCDDSDELYANREIKLARVLHAEMNAILSMPSYEHDCTLYVWPMFPCVRCAAHIIQSCKITRIVSVKSNIEKWADSIMKSKQLFSESNIPWTEYSPILFHAKVPVEYDEEFPCIEKEIM